MSAADLIRTVAVLRGGAPGSSTCRRRGRRRGRQAARDGGEEERHDGEKEHESDGVARRGRKWIVGIDVNEEIKIDIFIFI